MVYIDYRDERTNDRIRCRGEKALISPNIINNKFTYSSAKCDRVRYPVKFDPAKYVRYWLTNNRGTGYQRSAGARSTKDAGNTSIIIYVYTGQVII